MNEIIDFLAAILEPDDQVDLDKTAAEPFDWEPDRLYAWMLPQTTHEPFETGPSVIERFTARIVYVANDQGEDAARRRSRDVSDELDDRRARYLDILRERMSAPPYWAFASAREDLPPTTLLTRAVSLRLTGYRIVS